jgi:hypothetical protein
MAVPTHFKFTLNGVFTGTPEIWSTGFHFNRKRPLGTDAGLGDINEGTVTSAITAFIGSALFNTTVTLVDWRAYVIGTDGHMEGNGPLLHIFPVNTYKGTGSNVLPPQVSCVATLVANDRGPAQRGRMYLPGPAKMVQTGDSRLSVADATLYATAVSALLKGVSDGIDLPGEIGSAAAVNVSPGPVGSTTGTLQDIDHVEVGRVYDTVRNRRNKLVEARVVDSHIDW